MKTASNPRRKHLKNRTRARGAVGAGCSRRAAAVKPKNCTEFRQCSTKPAPDWGYIDEPVMRGGSGGLRYYHRNQQYSITALTDGGGSIVERYAYTAYGQVTFTDAGGIVQTASASNNRYTYTGREWDSGLNLYHFRARMYDAVAGRFVSRDPITYFDGMNMYGNYFVLFAMDPTGLTWYGSLGSGIIQGVVGGVIVVGVATVAITLGAPIVVVTIGIGVVGVVGGVILVADTIQDPSVDNIAENAGVLIGGAIVGGVAGRWLACRTSPPGNQPPPGRPNISHEWKQGFSPRPDRPIINQIIDVMAEGPTTGGAMGSITSGGAGIGDTLR